MKSFRIFSSTFLILFPFLFIPSVKAQPSGELPPGLDEYINKVLQTFEVPGMSVSIVKNGKIVLAAGYGVKQLGKADKVDANTLFSIASNSKAFTATALALLVEDGKLYWDDPVIKYLPWFQMADSYVSTHLTVRDLLVHQSGLAAYSGDLMLFPPSLYSRREILDKLKKLPLGNDFRTTYAYDNILYLAAGEIIAAVSGQSWEDFVKTRIFDPVGMPGSVSRYSMFTSMPNISTAHDRLNGVVRVVDRYTELNIGDASDPAGGILSNANDFSNWMITQLDSGRTPSRRILFKPETTKELWKLVRPIPITEVSAGLKPAQMDFFGYALGFRTYNYQRYKVVGHGGKLNGFVSQIAMVPDLDLGIAVFTNQESTRAYWSVIYHLLDFYMKNKQYDWLTNFKSDQDSSFAATKVQLNKNMVKADPSYKMPLSMGKFTGNFRDEVYGDVVISGNEKGMVMKFKQLPHLTADLKYFQFNTFLATFRNAHLKADSYVTYALNPDGTIDQIKLKIINPESDLEFHDVLLKPVEK